MFVQFAVSDSKNSKRNRSGVDLDISDGLTTGVWMWTPINDKNDNFLLLLDFQGFDDNGDESVNNKLFAVANLLSSTILFNMMHNVTYDSIKQLKPTQELS
jgi:hypothetical protein